MISVVCTACNVALSVVGDVTEVDQLVGQRSEFWKDHYTCFRCNGGAEGFLTAEISAAALRELQVYNVTALEAFAAMNGLGIPEERNCCSDAIVPMFEALGIKVHGKEYRGMQRFFLNSIELPDGTTLHLGASPQGACIYRITKPHSYARTNDVG